MGDSTGKNIDANTDWFVWVHDDENMRQGIVSGDLPENGVNYWNLYVKDHEAARRLGLNAYRIGIEWSRIFPKTPQPSRLELKGLRMAIFPKWTWTANP